MLRMSYMPSDFHPILLVLGQKPELLALAAIFERFSETGGTLSLTQAGVFSTDTQVTLEELPEGSSERPGLWPRARGANDLIWRLPRSYAWIFANEIANLGTSTELAGSATLECDQLGEIRAKVSIGEWEEGYLEDDFR
ncbi:hypothetical protein LCM17_08685 [Cereibacter sphaeroides]|nr:hypothetical protein [Cereibacter sphaeroides]